MRFAALAAVALVVAPAMAQAPSSAIRAAVADPARPEAERARDKYRHPAETLAFFGVTPTQTVVEFAPGGGWYTHVLMPLLAGEGHYIAAAGASAKAQADAAALIAKGPGAARASIVAFDPAASTMGPAGGADRVLTFRNIHNLLMAKDAGPDSNAPEFFAAAFMALKPGGMLGVVEHRLPEDRPDAAQLTSGYVKRSTIVRLATAAGFKLAGESAINANPKDTHDWPEGVWTLPPTYRLGRKGPREICGDRRERPDDVALHKGAVTAPTPVRANVSKHWSSRPAGRETASDKLGRMGRGYHGTSTVSFASASIAGQSSV